MNAGQSRQGTDIFRRNLLVPFAFLNYMHVYTDANHFLLNKGYGMAARRLNDE